MIATDKFVYVHLPKTGGSFVSSVLWDFSDQLNTTELYTARSPWGPLHTVKSKHGNCRAVPRAQRSKQFLSCVRNPYDLYVSEYSFGWWKRPEYRRYFSFLVPRFRRRFANYPDLTFEEYLCLYHAAFCFLPRNKSFRSRSGFGWYTQRFINFYFRHPLLTMLRMDDDYMASDRPIQDMFNIHFLRTDHLNEDLYRFLVNNGLDEREAEPVRDKGKVLPGGKGRPAGDSWERYYSPELKQLIRFKDRFLFKLFPNFDI